MTSIDPDVGEYVRPALFGATNSIKLVRNALIAHESTSRNTCACAAMYSATVAEPEEGEEAGEEAGESEGEEAAQGVPCLCVFGV